MRPDASSSFPVTQWTAVFDVCRQGTGAERRRAFERLCGDYWYPLYVFARRQGYPREDAEDFTQGFFHYLLDRDLVVSANP